MGATNLAPDEKTEDPWLDDALGVPPPARTKFGALLSYCCSLAAVAVCTWLAFHLHFEAAAVGFLYLIVVVVSAVYGDFWQATVTSIVVVACLDYFFFPPIFEFTIDDPRDWLALCTFEFTALMLSHLSRPRRCAQRRPSRGDRIATVCTRHHDEFCCMTGRAIPARSFHPLFVTSRAFRCRVIRSPHGQYQH